MRNATHVDSHREVVFVDSDIEISSLLATSIQDQADVVMLAGDENGLQQMRGYLIGRH
ncbi:hypothetical protein [Rugamonas sp. DEMB1]|uniref:hypothetical protein n=1 Tax=Rugamonas sp. DEMB1 TaxID=3039386 RepID=UPI00244D61EA|nr:hypothetical protein [Rugamonas sp. DEMB1]WGG53072.1 hypothetical protein QC826_13730 [Rugamonas sp. DEMB1]